MEGINVQAGKRPMMINYFEDGDFRDLNILQYYADMDEFLRHEREQLLVPPPKKAKMYQSRRTYPRRNPTAPF